MSDKSCCCGTESPPGCPCKPPFPWHQCIMTVSGSADGPGPFGPCYESCGDMNRVIILHGNFSSSYSGSVSVSGFCGLILSIDIAASVHLTCTNKNGKAYYSVSGSITTIQHIQLDAGGVLISNFHGGLFASDPNNPVLVEFCGSPLIFTIPGTFISDHGGLNIIGAPCHWGGATITLAFS